jgi:large-conductance mechanosensitive channel
METVTTSTAFTLSLSNPVLILGIILILWSKSFRDFVEDWGFMFMVISWYFYGFIGWILLWIFYEFVVFMHNDGTTKKKKKKAKKKTEKKDPTDEFFDDAERLRKIDEMVTNKIAEEVVQKSKKYI